jgi:iron complex outermembrane recepter protein
MKSLLKATTALALASIAMPAFAQDAAAEDGAEAPGIIVTAQKREENLQEVPIAISVLGGEQLANSGALTLENAQYLVPSLNFRKAGTTLNQALFLRGVGTINFSIAAEPSVAAVLDGVVLSRAGEGFTDLFDVERIEVLRGPQGTLFGKNASAGVVSIITKRPTDRFEAIAEATIAEGGEYRGRVTVNLPMGENIAGRFTGFYGEYDGNIANLTTGENVNGYQHYGFRGVIEAELGALTLSLRGDWRKADDDCCAEIIGTTPSNAAAGILAPTLISGSNTRAVMQNLTTATREESWGVSLQADLDVGDHTLTSITSYRGWDNTEIRDGDWLDRPYVGITQLHDDGPQTSKTFTQELRLTSPAGGFVEYVVGAYYSHAESDRTFSRSDVVCTASTLPAVGGAVPCATTGGVSTFTTPFGTADFGSVIKNFSVFGQATFNVTDSIRLIGGLRWTHDNVDVYHIRRTTLAGPGIGGNFDAGVYNNGALVPSPGTGFLTGPSNGIPFTAGTSNDNVSGKAGLQVDLSQDVMAYASYTRGYKGPAYNVFFNMANQHANVIEPETVDAYEGGLKTTFLDGGLIVNLAGYYARYENYQANSPDFVNGVRTTRLINAGSVSTSGFELDFIAKPAPNFAVTGGLAYNKAKVVAFNLPVGADPSALIAPGTPLANAPEWKMSVGMNYTWETGGFANIEFASSLSMQSDQIYELSPSLATRLGSTVDGYYTLDASVALVDPNNAWRIMFFVKNLSDQSFASSIISGGPGGAFRYIIPREADRYVGVTFRVNFGQ